MEIALSILNFAFRPLSDDDEGKEESKMDLEAEDPNEEDEAEDDEVGGGGGGGANPPKDDDDEDEGIEM